MLALVWSLATGAAGEPEPVVFADEQVPPGTVLRRDQVYVARMDPAHRPPNTAADVAEVVGQLVTEPLLAGMPVRLERLRAPGSNGLGALLGPGEQLVRLPLGRPSSWPHPTDHVDVLQLEGEQGCVAATGVRVIAGEAADGTLSTDHEPQAMFVAVHLASPRDQAGALASLEPSRASLVERGPADQLALPADVARCGEVRPPLVARREERPHRRSDRGARVVELLRGENAFVAELRLPGGARIPPHRDATEEYLVVLEGQGIVTIDGTAYPIGPQNVVYMPARAKVSYVNGASPLLALQVFAGPSPADKYASWRLHDPPSTGSRPAP